MNGYVTLAKVTCPSIWKQECKDCRILVRSEACMHLRQLSLCIHQPTYNSQWCLSSRIWAHIRDLRNSSPQGLTSDPALKKTAWVLLKLTDHCINIFSRFQAAAALSKSPIYNLILGTNSVILILSHLLSVQIQSAHA